MTGRKQVGRDREHAREIREQLWREWKEMLATPAGVNAGVYLRRCREVSETPASEMAELLGIHESVLVNFESGAWPLTVEMAVRLERVWAFGTSAVRWMTVQFEKEIAAERSRQRMLERQDA